ncbi:hypothetical protein ATX59_07490 [Oenococcus oeni]|uniref:LicD/FKTN/FKRP nucleotidyltransferase domain-containing protein n=1 Tax=Oenococcus oeni TaxID=1247 RepID=A0A6N4A7K9_OENOE|nr:LicD family protein [Oenococcus oeni]OIM20751.1 hypothetical protein ATX59_07490 [Oenococcus oeni]
MKQINLKDQQKILLEILIFLDSMARKHDIEYSLGGGTLLGAVRHGGFIPWDSDADIMLSRPNYDKFISLIKQSKRGPYSLISNDYSSFKTVCFPYLFSKISDNNTVAKTFNYQFEKSGVFVDIFPIDGLPNGLNEATAFQKKIHRMIKNAESSSIKYYWTSNEERKILLKLVWRFPKFVVSRLAGNMAKHFSQVNSEMQSYNIDSSENAAWLGTFYNELYPSNYFKKYIDVDFEGHQFMAISEYDGYLKDLYGDYMKLPPKDKRVSHDFYKFYWKDEDR